jgi:hypothetical protein
MRSPVAVVALTGFGGENALSAYLQAPETSDTYLLLKLTCAPALFFKNRIKSNQIKLSLELELRKRKNILTTISPSFLIT